jgi:alpha-L-fucosidase
LTAQPVEAVLLNTGAAVETCVETTPGHWSEKPYLRVRNLPVNDSADTVLVVRLRFGQPAA